MHWSGWPNVANLRLWGSIELGSKARALVDGVTMHRRLRQRHLCRTVRQHHRPQQPRRIQHHRHRDRRTPPRRRLRQRRHQGGSRRRPACSTCRTSRRWAGAPRACSATRSSRTTRRTSPRRGFPSSPPCPPGTGLLLMANKNVHVFESTFDKNKTAPVMVIAYSTAFNGRQLQPASARLRHPRQHLWRRRQ